MHSITIGVAPANEVEDLRGREGVQVAPFALLRVAGLPYKVLQALRPARTQPVLDRLLALRAAQEECRPALEDALYRLIPKLLDTELRRSALRLRRDVHTDRAATLPAPQQDGIVEALNDPVNGRKLRVWLRANAEFDAALKQARATLEQEGEITSRSALETISREASFRRGLALACPGLLTAWARARDQSRLPNAKEQRSLFRYLIRAASKTSPFTTFMRVGLLPVESEATGASVEFAAEGCTSSVVLNRGMFARMYRGALSNGWLDNSTILYINRSIRDSGEGRFQAILSEYDVVNGRPWRQDRCTTVNMHPQLIGLLMDLGVRTDYGALLATLERNGIEAQRAAPLIRKLIQRGVLWLEPFTDALDPQPDVGFLRRTISMPSGNSLALSGVVAEMQGLVARARADDDQTRLQIEGNIRALDLKAAGLIGAEGFQEYQNAILEDCWTTRTGGMVGGELLTLIRQIGVFLQDQMAVNPAYWLVKERFLQQYGPDGVCTDILKFLMGALEHTSGLRTAEDWQGIAGASVRKAKSGARMGLTAYVQYVPGERQARRPALVVNGVYEGIGWLAARMSMGTLPDQLMLARRLREWLRSACAPAEPVDLPVCGECNDLQVHPPLTARCLRLPGEPIVSSAAKRGLLELTALRMRYNPATELLELFDAEDRRIMPVYLGAAMPLPGWGLPFLVALLGQPHYLRRPRIEPPALQAGDATGEDVIVKPRFCEGDLVLLRAAWWVRAARIKTYWLARGGVERLLDVALECRKYGIPEQFFVRSWQTATDLPPALGMEGRKPLWIDTRSSICLDLLERVADGSEWLVLTEALPGSQDLCANVEGDAHVSELHVEMTISAA